MLTELIEELKTQLAFEKQRDLERFTKQGWTQEYHDGFIAGMTQAIDVLEAGNEEITG